MIRDRRANEERRGRPENAASAVIPEPMELPALKAPPEPPGATGCRVFLVNPVVRALKETLDLPGRQDPVSLSTTLTEAEAGPSSRKELKANRGVLAPKAIPAWMVLLALSARKATRVTVDRRA